ncbi:amidoligase family protein [Nocardia sp. XZ_19_385]|uniref:amidoligase family protein n=1 Tax=Nocardia sp. XZ_19_385 TaxID=2769488 RepID=UPI00188E57C9|nr:amidoligase family protein [Nocardia sp. XZ_19_385]
MPVPTAVDTQCENCSAPTPEADLIVTADGQQVCEQCLLRFSQCQDCRRHTREITAILDGPDVCEDCADNYDTCDACHRRTRESSAVDNDERVCEDCLEQDYHDCLECSTMIRWDRRYCLACESVYCHDAVHDSDYKPVPSFHGTGPLYLGLELELRTPRGAFGAAVESSINHLDGLGYLKEDGSITNGRGFELVTHPMSYEYAHTHFPWRLLERLRQLGAYTDDEVGIHVHVSRAGFTSPAHVYRWLKFVYRNESAVTTLARRASTRWAQFCPNTRKRIGGIVKGEDLFSHRYQAVNTRPVHTFELRVFASSLQPQQVQAALAFADASVEYTRTLTAAQITRHNGWQWNAFVTWLAARPRYAPLLAELTDLEALECAC